MLNKFYYFIFYSRWFNREAFLDLCLYKAFLLLSYLLHHGYIIIATWNMQTAVFFYQTSVSELLVEEIPNKNKRRMQPIFKRGKNCVNF